MNTNYLIREATTGDLSILLDFEQALISFERPFGPHFRDGKISYYDINAYIKDPSICLVVAEKENKIVGSGYALIKENKPYKTPSNYVYLGFMYVLPEFRRQGINHLVMNFLFDWGKQQGYTEFQLEVFAENFNAINAYKKLGFSSEFLTMRINTES